MKTITQKDICPPMFIAVLFTVANIWKQLKCPSVDEGIKKLQCVYIYEYFSAITKNEILPFATTWVEFQGIMLSEVSQTKTNIIQSLLYVESKQTKTP